MPELTLGERSYLAQVINKYFPEEKNAYDIAEKFTKLQRGKFLAHYYNKENKEAREMIEQIKNYQTSIL